LSRRNAPEPLLAHSFTIVIMERKKILVVEDDRATQYILRAMLERAGYVVLLSGDGQSAFDLVKNEKPDLVLTDALIPKMHGFLLSKAIKALPTPPKVIILSGVYTNLTYQLGGKSDYGADDYLKKPIEENELLSCIRKHLLCDDLGPS
jgi:DNA-binding response OmpR family regulator